MPTPLISTVVSAYNYGQFVEQAVDSVLSQNFPIDQVEILVVDDGSTDDTSERARKYGSRIRYLYKPNGGQASTLNFGIAQARGQIITLLDADDFFLPDKLARVADAFERNPAVAMVYHPLLEWDMQTDERHESRFPLISGDIHTVPHLFLSYVSYPTSCVSFRRSLLNPLLPIPEGIRMLADAYPVNLIPFLAPILAIPEALVVYRVHGKNQYYTNEQQMSLEAGRKRATQWQIVIDAMSRWLADNGFTRKQESVREFVDHWTLHLQRRQFLIKPPGRFSFFWFLARENYVTSPLQTGKLTVLNYLWAFSVLFFGYEREHQMYGWRRRIAEAYRSLLRGSSEEAK